MVARTGGVLERAGHTEASVDISKLSKLNPSAVICEVMNEDGRMARLKDLQKFSKRHKIKIASIEDLIAYRLRNEKLIKRLTSKYFKYKNKGKYEFIVYENKLNQLKNFVIKKGNFSHSKAIRVRVISSNIKNSKLSLNNVAINKSLKYLSKFNNFVLIIINNKKIDKNEIEKITLRYYGIGAQDY